MAPAEAGCWRVQAGDEDEPDAEAVLPTPPASPVQQRDTAPDETRHAPCVGEEDGHGAGTAEAAAAAPAAADTARLYLPQSQVQTMTVVSFQIFNPDLK